MRRRPSRAIHSAPAPQSPPAAMGGLLSTPAPSPSTAVPLGTGSLDAAAADGSLKSPAVEAPRRSLRLADAASPDTPSSASSAGDGASPGAGGKRRKSSRASIVVAAVSLEVGELGSDGGEARTSGGTSGGSSGQGTRTSLRSGSWLRKRPVETDVYAEMGLGLDGEGSWSGEKVHDEVLHQYAEGTVKRRKCVSARLAQQVPILL